MTTILVTGAWGTLSTPLVSELDALGASVLTMRADGEPSPGTRIARFDDRDALERAFEGVHTLLLRLPLAPDMPAMARNAIEAARRAGVRHLVRVGPRHASPASPYALLRAHGVVDDLVMHGGLPWTLLHPSEFMQNWVTRFGPQVRAGTVTAVSADVPRPWVDARDVAAAAATVLVDPGPHAGGVYPITGPETLTLEAFAEVVGAAIGRRIRVRRATPDDVLAEMAAAGVPPWLAMMRDSVNRAFADGVSACVETVADRLVQRPRIDARTFARDYAPAWRVAGA